MNLAELKEAYKARKLALDSAKKEEEKYKALLKDAMLALRLHTSISLRILVRWRSQSLRT